MTEQQKSAFINALHTHHADFNSPYSDVRDAVEAMMDILINAVEDMECDDD